MFSCRKRRAGETACQVQDRIELTLSISCQPGSCHRSFFQEFPEIFQNSYSSKHLPLDVSSEVKELVVNSTLLVPKILSCINLVV